MIMAYRVSSRAVFLYGFAKNDRDNVGADELLTLRTVGANWLAAGDKALEQAEADGVLKEIGRDNEA